MTKIINTLNNGNKNGAKVGAVNVNSFNVAPDTIVAAPVAATIPLSDLNLYDYFKVAQTTAGTDEFDLPSAAAVGQVITLYAVSAFELRTETETDDINDVASLGYAVIAGDLMTCTKVTATAWTVTKLTILGAAVTVVAGIAA